MDVPESSVEKVHFNFVRVRLYLFASGVDNDARCSRVSELKTYVETSDNEKSALTAASLSDWTNLVKDFSSNMSVTHECDASFDVVSELRAEDQKQENHLSVVAAPYWL